MTPNDYINKAIHAIETDQPNLAILYMRRGIQVSKLSRWEAMAACSPFGPVEVAIERFAEGLAVIGEAFRPVFDAFTRLGEAMQSDYALVPSPGCCSGRDGDDCTCTCHDYKGGNIASV